MKTSPNQAKPYHKCLSCTRFRKECGGIPTRCLDLQSWCEYMHDVKNAFHLSNAEIAKEADVSIKTLERIMAINCEQDIMRSTARRIELAIIGPVGKNVCGRDYEDVTATERINRLLLEIAKLIDKYLE